MNKSLIGVDIGGSHLTASYLHPGNLQPYTGSIIRRQVNSLASKNEILSSWIAAFSEMGIHADTRIAIAMPAPFDYNAGIAKLREQGKFRALYGLNLRNYFSDNLHLRGDLISFFNDAASFLQGEAMFQQIPSEKRLLGITLGTGLGSAYKTGLWAEDAALWSSIFKGQQAEYYLGTGWFVSWAKQEHGIQISGLKDLLENPSWNILAVEALDLFGRNLGEFLALHSSLKQIDLIVIGGNLAKANIYFEPAMRKIFVEKNVKTDVVFSQLGENAALIGAAASSCLL